MKNLLRCVVCIVKMGLASSAVASGVDFSNRPLLAGKAKLAGEGYVVKRTLGVAAFAPEMRLPVELVYDSSSESSGLFGYGWRSPQLESSVRWDKDGLRWTTPWGEEVKFFPKKEKTPKDAVKLAPIEAAKKGRGLYSPYSDWEADSASSDYAKSKSFVVSGKDGLAGWRFAYEGGRLVRIETPQGGLVGFEYAGSGELVAVSSQGVRFVEAENAAGRVTSLKLNGVGVKFDYGDLPRTVLPKTVDGLASKKSEKALTSVRIASLDPETFAYANGYLASMTRGARTEKLVVQSESFKDRIQNLKSEDRKSGVEHTGRFDGRLLSDGDFVYSYQYGIQLKDKSGETASYNYDRKNGVFKTTDFAGRTVTTYYFMRYDAAYLGKVRKIVDGRGRDLVSFRYDKTSGKPVRVTDRLGNKRLLEYDANGNCVKLSRRADWSLKEEPVRSFAYDRKGFLSSVSELDADGKAVSTVSFACDKSGRPTRVADGRRTVSVAYSRSGFPVSLKDDFSAVSFTYDRYNRPVTSTDPYGVVTTRAYADHGGLAKIETRDGAEVLSSVTVGYDGNGLPVSVTDQDGLTTSCDRDALRRIVKEKYADDAEVAYAYDRLGRLTSVLDENGHEIRFGWDRFGLSSRLTAAEQLTDVKRDRNGLVTSVASSKKGRIDRTVVREYDEYDRVTKVDYGQGETETFAYDTWGRLAEHTRGKLKETYGYDHFGRLVKKDEGGLVYTYAYDACGNRTSRKVRSSKGETTEERRVYDRYGRLVEISSFGSSVKYRYDAKGRVVCQTVDGSPIEFVYTKRGRLAGKYLGGKEKPDAAVEYEYSPSGRITARTANGFRQIFEYDRRGQLVAVKEGGSDIERYVYDKAGNMTKKTIAGKTSTFTFDGANQLVSLTCDGVTTRYEYDAAGRMIKEGNKTYTYGYLDKVTSVKEGANVYTYGYHVDGQLATADYGKGNAECGVQGAETFAWDGLALIQRGDEKFVNEPHVGGGNPVASSKGTTYFNDMLGTTVGAKQGRKYTAAALTAFGESLENDDRHSQPQPSTSTYFTGKPQVPGLGYVFLMRNYRAGLGKWQTADPLGYPDGWNALAYCNNGVIENIDLWGGVNLNLFKKGTLCWRIADLYDETGYFTVGGHGSRLHDENDSELTAEQLAEKIRNAGWDGTTRIKLLSCNTGNCNDYCQELANLLGVSVFAADTLVWYITTERKWYALFVDIFSDEEDVMLITGGTVAPYQRKADDMGKPDYDSPGRYIEFNPE